MVRSYGMLNDGFWIVLLITYRKRTDDKCYKTFISLTEQISEKITVPEKGNQRGTFSNLLPSTGFIEIHRLKCVILVPPGGNFKSVAQQRIYGKVPKVPLSLNSYIEIFSLSHKKNKNNNRHTKERMLYVSHVCIIKKKGT